MTTWQSYLADHERRYTEELVDFVAIPSISAQEAHISDVLRAADWVSARLAAAGMQHVTFLETGKHKAVYADWLHAPGKPTLLFYGHFDVQPPDPLDEWVSPPFTPQIVDDRIYARGVSDSKGNVLEAIIGLEALLKTTEMLPVNVKFLAEGQEEIGSPDLGAAIEANKNLLSCDFVINTDSGQGSDEQPTILLGTRGMIVLELFVQGPKVDLHSGIFGGAVQNPIHALAHILDSLHSSDGKVAVEGYYADVADVSAEELASVPPGDEEDFAAMAGVTELFGEIGYTSYERTTMRPTLEINGITGGYQGDGAKTVIPAKASAKITCRLVANQIPSKIVELIKKHIKRNAPAGVSAELFVPGLQANPFSSAHDSVGNAIAAKVLTEVYEKPPFYVRTGGSIPILDVFAQILGKRAISFGFSQQDEKFHSPNEFLRLTSFRRGVSAFASLLEAFGRI